MTRYARAKGSKACNSRQAGSATPWQLFKEQIVSAKSNTENVNETLNSSQDDKVVANDSEGSWYNFQTNYTSTEKDSVIKSTSSSQNKRKRNESVRKTLSTKETIDKNKIEKDDDAGHVLKNIKTGFYKRSTLDKSDNPSSQMKKSKFFTSSGIFRVTDKVPANNEPKREKASFNSNDRKDMRDSRRKAKSVERKKKDVTDSVPSDEEPVREKVPSTKNQNDLKDSRRKEKAIKREKKKVCFCCRRWGHQLADCPDAKPASFCYSCGSTEHTMSHCSKPGKKTYKYAHCFVCNEEGHLARLCPDNPKGNYPKGGSCLLCGEVTHMRADCPKAKQDSKDLDVTLTCLSSGPIESLPEDLKTSYYPTKSKRIVQFT